jgi:hypothetical protein
MLYELFILITEDINCWLTYLVILLWLAVLFPAGWEGDYCPQEMEMREKERDV